MPTQNQTTASFRDHSISAASSQVPFVQHGSISECSDPYTEWALRFNHDLTRAEARIHDWTRNAALLADDDLEAPSRETIRRAIEIIGKWRVQVMDRVPPSSVRLLNLRGVSLGSGGEISFELSSKPLAVIYRIESDGTVTVLNFKDNQLIKPDQGLR